MNACPPVAFDVRSRRAAALPRLILFAFLLVTTSAAHAERLQKCPVDTVNQTDVADAVTATPSCAQAYEVMNVCRLNSGGDVALANIVVQKCEQVFGQTLEAPALKAYQAARESCTRRFSHKDGTVSVSYAATCEAGVAVVFAHRADLAAMKPRRDPRRPPYGDLAPVQ